MAQLYGACACERNQYTVIIPDSATSTAQVFFDNSTTNRRTQATPVTAWLRVPLDWYHSTTYALFPDETHNSIRRTFNTPVEHPSLPPTRKQFCGYCGTHLTAWNEAEEETADSINVTLGSLLNESLLKLEALDIMPDAADEEGEEDALVKGGWIDDETHIPGTNEGDMGGVEGPGAISSPTKGATARKMSHRGIPYFEEMVENSRLGRIKRQKGAHTSHDGRTTVSWEVVEIDNSEPSGMEMAADTPDDAKARVKRQKMDS